MIKSFLPTSGNKVEEQRDDAYMQQVLGFYIRLCVQ